MMLTVPASSVASGEEDHKEQLIEEWLEQREQISREDLEKAETFEFTVAAPGDDLVGLEIDWTGEEPTAKPVPAVTPDDHASGTSGCQVGVTLSFGWANDPITSASACGYQFHSTGIETTTLVCGATGSGCLIDGLGSGFSGFLFVVCPPADAGHVDWPSLSIVTVSCTAFLFGSNPVTWGGYDSIVFASGTPGLGFHTPP